MSDKSLSKGSEQLPNDPAENSSPELNQALEEIESTQKIIADRTGLEGQKLAETTDDFLTGHAEHVAQMDASDAPRVIETALIEGALEEIGQRPNTDRHNPIEQLESDGYDSEVVEGVRDLERKHVRLPGGISAAEVVAQKVDKLDSAHSRFETYQGNWFNLQRERMSSPDFRDKFKRFIETHMPSLEAGQPGSILQKPESFRQNYQKQLEEFDANLEKTTSSVNYGNTRDVGGKTKESLGHGKIGHPGTVYKDAEQQDGSELSAKQKDIVAAHEAYHGMVSIKGSAVAEVKSGFDWDAYNDLVDMAGVKQPNYLRNPDELTARMAQFKNYFGMKAGEEFTPDHLHQLRLSYIEDTGLDNGISTMLKIITPATEKQFIKLMNELPV